MQRTLRTLFVLAFALTIGSLVLDGQTPAAQGRGRGAGRGTATTPAPARGTPATEVYKLDEAYLNWPVAPADRAYAAIDGKHLHQYVQDITAISRRYRDNGHPQYWGRIQGTAADLENAEWVAARFKQIGLEVRTQPFDLPPQWMPKSWSVVASAGGKTLNLDTAQLTSRTLTLPGDGLDLEAVWVGLGYPADFAGRNVKGKAVFIYSVPQPGVWSNSASSNGATARAFDGGAAAVFVVIGLPGNIRTQFGVGGRGRGAAPDGAAAAAPAGPAPITPGFTMGLGDGNAMRELMEQAPTGQSARVKIKIDAEMVPGLKSYNVWGVLPGATDEKIMVIAHRDGYFESAGDNASGMSTMIGLAEYFAKIPRAQRRRTIEFIGTTGHHGTAMGVQWMADNRDTALAKTALVMNAEHTSLTLQNSFAGRLRPANTAAALHWSFNGSPKLIDIAINAFSSFGVPTYTGTDGVAMAEISRISQLVPSFGVIDVDTYYHSDHETAATVPWTGLGNVTRAFAKIIDEVNKVEIKDLQRAAAGN